MTKKMKFEFPALRIEQSKGKYLYAFAVNGKLIHDFASVQRIARTDENELMGYQRPEVFNHIANIRHYLESAGSILPNALVLAFNSSVNFLPSGNTGHGTLEIPLEEGKPGWIVDGQQRAAALRDARVNNYSVFIVAFIADDEKEAMEQFILVNSAKPLPKGLIYELLPGIEAQLPSQLEKKRLPAILLGKLNSAPDSPFFQRIKTPTSPQGDIQDNSILRMCENSLSDGALSRFFDPKTMEPSVNEMVSVLSNYWCAVAEIFPKEWNSPPRQSRLSHGAGIAAMGYLMDAAVDRLRKERIPEKDRFVSEILPINRHCCWSSGFWEFGLDKRLKWNEIQNTSKHIKDLTNYLLIKYRHSYA